MNLVEALARSVREHREHEALDDGRRSVSYAELGERVERLARGLASLEVRAGERVAILSKNRVEYVELYFACASLGAVLVPLNWRLGERELIELLDDSEACALIVEDELLEGRTFEGPRVARLRERIVIGTPRGRWRALEALYVAGLASFDRSLAGGDDVAIQMYTSGTTGVPKGAMLTHGNVLAMVASWLAELALRAREDRFLQVTPLFHVGGMLMAMSCVAAGARLLLQPEFLPAPAARALAGQDVTHALFVPSMLQWLLDEPGIGKLRFPRLRLVVYGAAPMPRALLERAIGVLGCGFLQGYGLTETAGVLTVLRPSDHVAALERQLGARLCSAGRAVSCCEVRVVDGEGLDAVDEEVGEIVARGANVSPGYWKLPHATAEVYRDGWFHTGDLATRDGEGFITIVDRLKDMLLVGGENVYPREIEDVLRAHPAVADIAVIGIPHTVWGEEALALIVRRAGTHATDRELIQHCRAHLARFKCPTRVEFRAEIPRNSAGKIQKRELREPYWRDRERRV